MRLLKLEPDDPELFQYQLNCDQLNFFLTHSCVFKKMWEEQGKTYWLRFLLTFQLNFQGYLLEKPEFGRFIVIQRGHRILDFAYICIHKFFIEVPSNSPLNFIEKVFEAVKNIQNLLKAKPRDPFCDGNSVEVFFSSLENFDLPEDFPSEAARLACTLYFTFVNGICTLLKRWLKEEDLSEEALKSVDYTLYYWKPLNRWTSNDFIPSCFEKYLSTYWKKDLPKMLLTCNVHEIFDAHIIVDNCCSLYTGKKAIFGLHKEKYKIEEPFSLNVVKMLRPDVEICKQHSNCYIKIQHDVMCLEPYVCAGHTPCMITCETVSKMNWKKKDVNGFWKKSSVEVFTCKDKNKRCVSTFVESSITQIETYFRVVETSISQFPHDLEELLFFNNDPTLRNSYTQHKRKEEYRRKLRKKLHDKYEYDFQDPLQLQHLYDRAEQLWLQEMCSETFKNMFSSRYLLSDIVGNSEDCLKILLKSVAMGTCGIVFGRVVLPSRKLASLKNVPKTDNQLNTQGRTDLQIKSKKKKNKKITETSKTILESEVTLQATCISECERQSPKDPAIITRVSSKIADSSNETELREISVSKEANGASFVKTVNDSKREIHLDVTTKSLKKDNSHESDKKLTIVGGAGDKLTEVKSDNDEELDTFYNFVNTSDGKLANKTEMDSESCEFSSVEQNAKFDPVLEKSKDKTSDLFQRKNKLKICAFCQKVEVKCKTFKRCSRCKAENLPDQYYYCSRECQIADWEKSHREKHLKKSKIKI